MSPKENIHILFQKYLNNKCTQEEAEQVLDWLAEDVYSNEQKEAINQLFTGIANENIPVTDELKQKLNSSFQIICNKIYGSEIENSTKVKVKPFGWFRGAAAAIFIFALFGGVLYFLHNEKISSRNVASLTHNNPADILPGSNKALLILSNGEKVVLEDAGNGNLAQQGSSAIIKDGNKLKYNETGTRTNVVYNTIVTPKGGQYQLTLADGSEVWLNSASSIKFPVAFSATDRKVEITGEAYFEIAKNIAKPFTVTFTNPDGKKGEVAVLGTSFNIMAYADEDISKTTLVEGSVKISYDGSSAELSPRQQANLKNQSIKILNNVNVEEVAAWKNGFFQFDGASLQYVMRQITRWYGVNVIYKGNSTNRKFGGKIPMNSNLSEVLKVLEASNIKFIIENRTIIVNQ